MSVILTFLFFYYEVSFGIVEVSGCEVLVEVLVLLLDVLEFDNLGLDSLVLEDVLFIGCLCLFNGLVVIFDISFFLVFLVNYCTLFFSF